MRKITDHMYAANQMDERPLPWYLRVMIGCGTGSSPTSVPFFRNSITSTSCVTPLQAGGGGRQRDRDRDRDRGIGTETETERQEQRQRQRDRDRDRDRVRLRQSKRNSSEPISQQPNQRKWRKAGRKKGRERTCQSTASQPEARAL